MTARLAKGTEALEQARGENDTVSCMIISFALGVMILFNWKKIDRYLWL
jgi:hypothetical protein